MNVPDDWHCYYRTCSHCGSRYHLSEGGCDCWDKLPPDDDLTERMKDANYEWDTWDQIWSKLVRAKIHVARKDHKDGKVKKGERYNITTYRIVEPSGISYLLHHKTVLDRPGWPALNQRTNT